MHTKWHVHYFRIFYQYRIRNDNRYVERNRFIVRNHRSVVGIPPEAPESGLRIDWIIYTRVTLTVLSKVHGENGVEK